MSERTATWLAWSLWVVNVLVSGTAIVISPEPSGLASDIAPALFIFAFATTGALVASRRPGNPLGWLMCAAALSFTLGAVAITFSGEEGETRRGDLPGAALAAWVGTFVWTLGIGPAATFLFLLFPNGRLPSRRWRPVAWLAGGSIASVVIGVAFDPGPIEDTRLLNPVGIPGAEAILSGVEVAGLIGLVGALFASITSLFVRFRAAATEERQQLKWIAYAGPLVALCVAGSFAIELTISGDAASNLSNALVSASVAIVPVAIGIAVLRHRLYDIDVVINRTLVYGALTATLAAAYLGTVLVLQLALSPLTEDSGLGIAGSTLAVAALFRPARARIQAFVDRRFYRRRYDAARTLERFSARLRDEVELDALGADLRGAVHETVQPAHVSLWLRTAGPGRAGQ